MSLLDDRPINPAKYRLQIKSGAVSYYDKQSGENVEVPTPFEFIVLDQLATIKGWSDSDDSWYWSNEVRRSGEEKFTVRTSQGKKAEGLWKDIKFDPNVAGSKFNSVIYLAHQSEGGMQISILSLTGAALNSWIEFTKKANIKKDKVILKDWADAKKGAVKYKTPVFESVPMEDGERDEAKQLARKLKDYHDEYFSYKPESYNGDVVSTKSDSYDQDEINLADIPFGN